MCCSCDEVTPLVELHRLRFAPAAHTLCMCHEGIWKCKNIPPCEFSSSLGDVCLSSDTDNHVLLSVVWMYPSCKSSQKHFWLCQLSSGLQWPCPGWLVVTWSIRAVRIFKIFNGLQGISMSEKAGKWFIHWVGCTNVQLVHQLLRISFSFN